MPRRAEVPIDRGWVGDASVNAMAGGTERGVSRGDHVVGGRRSKHRGEHGKRDQRDHHDLLAPLLPEEAKGPPSDGAPGRAAAVASGHGWRGSSSDSGLLGDTVWSTMRPSLRNTVRSAHEASWASWVTTMPATPCQQAARSRRMTDSPNTGSRAPVGSTARSRWWSPTMARAMAARCRSPLERSSGNLSALSVTPSCSRAARDAPTCPAGARA